MFSVDPDYHASSTKPVYLIVNQSWVPKVHLSSLSTEQCEKVLDYGISMFENESRIYTLQNNKEVSILLKQAEDDKALNEKMLQDTIQLHLSKVIQLETEIKNIHSDFHNKLQDQKFIVQKSIEACYETQIQSLQKSIQELQSDKQNILKETEELRRKTLSDAILEVKSMMIPIYENRIQDLKDTNESILKSLKEKEDKLLALSQTYTKTKSTYEKAKINELEDEQILKQLYEPIGAEVTNSSASKYSGDFQIILNDGTVILFDSKSHSSTAKIASNEVAKLKRDVDIHDTVDGGIMCSAFNDIAGPNGKPRPHLSLDTTTKGKLIVYLSKMKIRQTYDEILVASNIIQHWKQYKDCLPGSNIYGFIDYCRLSYRSVEKNIKNVKNSIDSASESLKKAMESFYTFKRVIESDPNKTEFQYDDTISTDNIDVFTEDTSTAAKPIILKNKTERLYDKLKATHHWIKKTDKDDIIQCSVCNIDIKLTSHLINKHQKTHNTVSLDG